MRQDSNLGVNPLPNVQIFRAEKLTCVAEHARELEKKQITTDLNRNFLSPLGILSVKLQLN